MLKPVGAAPRARGCANLGCATPFDRLQHKRGVKLRVILQSVLPRGRALVTASLVAACVTICASFSGTAIGQGNLATLDGLTALQQPTATAVNKACVQFGAAGLIPDPNGTPVQRLYYTCRVMVQTANQLQHSGNATNSLNISNDQLRTGV